MKTPVIRCFLIGCLLLLFVLAACGQKTDPTSQNSENGTTAIQPESSERFTAAPESSTQPSETEPAAQAEASLVIMRNESKNPADYLTGGMKLDAKEIGIWEEFFEDRLAGHFLLVNYQQAEDIDLSVVLHDGTDMSAASSEVSGEEKQRLEEHGFSPKAMENLDILKIDEDDIERVLRKYLGFRQTETGKTLTDGTFVYLPEYKAYYHFATESFLNQYRISEGVTKTDGSVVLHWEIKKDGFYKKGDEGIVTLEKSGEEWHFRSNVILKQHHYVLPCYVCLYSGDEQTAEEEAKAAIREYQNGNWRIYYQQGKTVAKEKGRMILLTPTARQLEIAEADPQLSELIAQLKQEESENVPEFAVFMIPLGTAAAFLLN